MTGIQFICISYRVYVVTFNLKHKPNTRTNLSAFLLIHFPFGDHYRHP